MAYQNPNYPPGQNPNYPPGQNPNYPPEPPSDPPPPAGAPPPAPPPAANSDAAYIAEVRASGKGKSEDYQRFSDAEILAWKKYYQGGGKFKNDYGDIVDKPDERGPNTPGNRNGTGDQGDYGRGWNNASLDSEGDGGGGSGGGGGGGKGGKGKGTAPEDAPQGEFDPLQARLLEMYKGGEGAFAGPRANGQDLRGGGIWWGNGGKAPAAGGAIPAPGGADGNRDIGFGGRAPAGVNPALAQAAMTAFSPKAPSAQGGGFAGRGQSSQAPVQSAIAPQVGIAQSAPIATPALTPDLGAIGVNPLTEAVRRRYSNPNSWWSGQ